MSDSVISKSRDGLHATLLDSILHVDFKGDPTNADTGSQQSLQLAQKLLAKVGTPSRRKRVPGQRSGKLFESACATFVDETFLALGHLRPGNWEVCRSGEGFNTRISEFAQYSHITVLDELAKSNPDLAAAIGRDYLITSDVVVIRRPEPDDRINVKNVFVNESVSTHSTLREAFNEKPILHASISCKWTIRSDRAQNIRSEGITLIKNRKGRLPHVVAVTAEPLPTRIASIALGTGEIDCVYHFALYELEQAAREFADESPGFEPSLELLTAMIEGDRLKDISDLPLDLAS